MEFIISGCDIGFEDWGLVERKGGFTKWGMKTARECMEACVRENLCWAFTYKNINMDVPKCLHFKLKLGLARNFDFYHKQLDAGNSIVSTLL